MRVLDRQDRRIALALFLLLNVTYVLIGPGYRYNNPNVETRVLLVDAVLNQRTLRIDAYAAGATDRAVSGGHFYSDKAPGLSLTALPFVAALHHVATALHMPTVPHTAAGYTEYHVLSVWIGTLVKSIIFTALAACALGERGFVADLRDNHHVQR